MKFNIKEWRDKHTVKEDYSTMNLKSNIAEKWVTNDDITNDIQDYLDAIIAASGKNLGKSVKSAILKGIKKAGL